MANWFIDLDENESEIWSKLNQLNLIKILKKHSGFEASSKQTSFAILLEYFEN